VRRRGSEDRAAPAQGASAEHEGRVVLESGLSRRLGLGLRVPGLSRSS
jgi:hypothetical protein